MTGAETAHNEKSGLPVPREEILRNGRGTGTRRLKEGLIACSSIAISAFGAFLGVGVALLLAPAWPLWIWAAAGSLIVSTGGLLALVRPRFKLMRHFFHTSPMRG